MPSLRQFFSHRLIWLALLVALGIGALFARTIWTIRNDEWSYAAQTNANLARTLEQGLAWSLDSFDKSLERVAREVARPEVWALPPDLRARVVFDNSLRAGGWVTCSSWMLRAMSFWTRARSFLVGSMWPTATTFKRFVTRESKGCSSASPCLRG